MSIWSSSNNGINFNKSEINRAQHLLLQEKIDNGEAIQKEDTIIVFHETICSLNEIDQQLLALPPLYPFDICIKSFSSLDQSDFKYNWGFYNYNDGDELFGKRNGSLLKLSDQEEYVLSLEQFRLSELLDTFNEQNEIKKTFDFNLLAFSKIKSAALEASAILDLYLNSQFVIAPDEIKLSVKKENDKIELVPEIQNIDSIELDNKFSRFPIVQKTLSFDAPDGGRVRVPFNKKQHEELKKLKKNKRLNTKNLELILEHPEEIFDPDVINLDEFSKRVAQIGYYKPKFYPFICPYKSKWIPGIIIEKGPEEKIKIDFKTKEEFNSFKNIVETANKNGDDNIHWKNEDIPVSEAHSIIEIGEKQFKDQNNPAKESNGEKDKKVLIIFENVEKLEHDESFEKLMDSFVHKYQAPPCLKSDYNLLDHQIEGLSWLQSLSMKNLTGALLADDMGLGKTLQILSFIKWYHEKINKDKKPYLLVAPISLLENWENEYRKFFENNGLSTLSIFGRSQNKLGNLHNKIILTSYETIRIRQLDLGKIDWAVIILDEAQRIKTPGTLVTNAIKALKGDFKIAATGTPVENSLVDLWCIMDYAIPGLLGSAKEFAKEYQNKLKKNDTNVAELGEQLRLRIGLFLKRRLKKDILKELPQKHIIPHKKEMPKEQFERYEFELKRIQNIDPMNEGRSKILESIHTIKDISDHPYLIDMQFEKYDTNTLINTSAKLISLIGILENVKTKGEKVIIFSDRRKTQRLIAKVVLEKYNINASIINGDTPTKPNTKDLSKQSRQQAIDRFQDKTGFNIIIMSPIAAGVGLNVTQANHVIHYSRHWNPAKEDQATDRVYRIGQKKEVYIHLLLAISPNYSTFDIILDELLENKRKLATSSLFPTEKAEVVPFEIINGIKQGNINDSEFKFTIDDIDKLDPFKFEALIGVMFYKKGFNVNLTPKSNDRGADVVARNFETNYLIQVKHSNTNINDNCIGEVLKSLGYYKQLFNTNFRLAIATNQFLNTNAKQMANNNNVQIIERKHIISFLQDSSITLEDIIKLEDERLDRI